MRPLESVFDRLNAAIEHPEMLAGIAFRASRPAAVMGMGSSFFWDTGVVDSDD